MIVKRNPEHRELPADDPRLKEWEPIFQAAERGLFPSRVIGVLEMSDCIRAMRRSRAVPDSHPHPRP